MTVVLLPRVVPWSHTLPDANDEAHNVCCVNRRVTLCGSRFTDAPDDVDEATCVVCCDLDVELVCPVAGRCLVWVPLIPPPCAGRR